MDEEDVDSAVGGGRRNGGRDSMKAVWGSLVPTYIYVWI